MTTEDDSSANDSEIPVQPTGTNPMDFDNLSDEQINEYKQKIIDAFRDVDANNPEELLKYLQANYGNEIPHLDRPEKLTICPHEIVFSVMASVMEENEKGETIGCKEVCQKNYHIPIPPQNDYNIYMEAFFEHISECIQQSSKYATKASEKIDNE